MLSQQRVCSYYLLCRASERDGQGFACAAGADWPPAVPTAGAHVPGPGRAGSQAVQRRVPGTPGSEAHLRHGKLQQQVLRLTAAGADLCRGAVASCGLCTSSRRLGGIHRGVASCTGSLQLELTSAEAALASSGPCISSRRLRGIHRGVASCTGSLQLELASAEAVSASGPTGCRWEMF